MSHFIIFQLSIPLNFSSSRLGPCFSSNINDAVCYHDLDILIRVLQMLIDNKVDDLFIGVVSPDDTLYNYISASEFVSFYNYANIFCDVKMYQKLEV